MLFRSAIRRRARFAAIDAVNAYIRRLTHGTLSGDAEGLILVRSEQRDDVNRAHARALAEHDGETAMAEARRHDRASTPRYLLAQPMLADFLLEGMLAFGHDCADAEEGHFQAPGD